MIPPHLPSHQRGQPVVTLPAALPVQGGGFIFTGAEMEAASRSATAALAAPISPTFGLAARPVWTPEDVRRAVPDRFPLEARGTESGFPAADETRLLRDKLAEAQRLRRRERILLVLTALGLGACLVAFAMIASRGLVP